MIMPDISEELNIIASEPKGRLVKQAIYDALLKINQEADRRPVAKLGIPIDEAIIDTGWVTNWVVGDIVPGILVPFDGEIRNFNTGDTTYTSYVGSIYANHTGKLILVSLTEWQDEPVEPTIRDIDEYEWTKIGRYKLPLRIQNGKGNAIIRDAYPEITDFNVKGYIQSPSELPGDDELEQLEIGDIYVCIPDDSLYMVVESYTTASHKWWEHVEEASAILTNTVDRMLCIWCCNITEPREVRVNASFPITGSADEDAYKNFAFGAFAVYDTPEASISTCTPSVRLINSNNVSVGVKRITDSYKGSVATYDSLPTTDVGNNYMYYVIDEDNYYVYKTSDNDWHLERTVYDANMDDIHNVPDVGTYQAGSKKLYICASLDPLEDMHLVLEDNVSEDLRRAMHGYYHISGSECALSVWGMEDGQLRYPRFRYQNGTEMYRVSCNGSLAIIPIEFVPEEVTS
jgi:hypothetical protein